MKANTVCIILLFSMVENAGSMCGGTQCDIKEALFFVRLVWKKTRLTGCGAALMTMTDRKGGSASVGITAGHCLCDGNAKGEKLWKQFYAVLGDGSGQKKVLEIVRATCHDDWNGRDENKDEQNDIAIFQLNETVQVTGRNAFEAHLAATSEEYKKYSKCKLYGWGAEGEGSDNRSIPSKALKYLNIDILGGKKCHNWHGMKTFCGISVQPKPGIALQGDSGGALVCELARKNYIVGVARNSEFDREALSKGKCEGSKIVFTSVPRYSEWLLEKYKIYEKNGK